MRVTETTTFRSRTEYTVSYSLTLNGTRVSVRKEAGVNVTQLKAALGEVLTPGGQPYSLVAAAVNATVNGTAVIDDDGAGESISLTSTVSVTLSVLVKLEHYELVQKAFLDDYFLQVKKFNKGFSTFKTKT